ncbi:hypothetical protein J2Z40_000415 [Cytobacillus eiseniae]|uniref:Spore coat protein n=1 Tax=Cytobacillus eiseniae TaxID=762947 RepID=A0ABS4RAE3_9BACI|nr:hypothetical protein [Cytobacillus eiseniae]MBP2239862.1 hypothetical protein [Cytobacillus eiseniae]
MTQSLTQTEVENLRRIIGEHGMISNKLEAYSQSAMDPELKAILQRDAQAAKSAQQQLLSFLQ